MNEETPGSQPEDPRERRSIWCHVCEANMHADDRELLITFSPQGWTLYRDGSLDHGWPADVFVDVAHLTCGNVYRVVCNTKWDELRGAYVDGESAAVELLGFLEADGVDYLDTREHAEWQPTYEAVLAEYKEARDRLSARLAESPPERRGDGR